MVAVLLAGCIGNGEPEETAEPPDVTPTETQVEAPASPEPPIATEEDLDAQYTQAAETIIAELTLNAPPTETLVPDVPKPTLTPTETLPPTSTPFPTKTPLVTNTPMPTATTGVVDQPTQQVSSTADSIAELTFKLVYEDDFAWPQGFVDGSSDDFTFHYGMGGYVMLNKVRDDIVWSVRKTPYSDVRVEATGQRISGPRDGYFGVTCRHEDGSNYYALVVGSDGTYGIAKQLGGNLEFIKLEQDTQGRVHSGNGINHVRGDCIGSSLTLYANGHMLMEVEDTTFSAGSVGMAVGTRSREYYEVLYTYIAAYLPVE